MPEWLAVVLLGLIEGVTEFLPVSSTGHLLLVQNGGLVPRRSDLFNVVIQSGAVVAVVAVFWRRCLALVTEWRSPEQRDYLSKLVVAFGITGAGGVAMKLVDFELPESTVPVASATLVGGIAILLAEWRLRNAPGSDRLSWSICVAVAIAQLLAAWFPGTSRSGACIVAAMLLGLNRPLATEFSFLLGVPTLLAAGALQVVSADGGVAEDWGMVALGTAVSAVTAFGVVVWLLRFVQSHTLNGFGIYRVILALVLFAYG